MPLDEVGLSQAMAAAAVLAVAAPVVVLSSDLSRARVTAEAVAAASGAPLRLDARLRELDLGAWQGLTSAEAAERFPQEHGSWLSGVDVPRGGGETYAQAGARAAQCVLESVRDTPSDTTVVAVTHGGTARAALGVLLDLPPDSWWRLAALGNACWSVAAEGHRGWRLERHGVGAGSPVGPADGASELGGAVVRSPSPPGGEPVR